MIVKNISLKEYKTLILGKEIEFSQTYEFYLTYNLSHFKKIKILQFQFSDTDSILLPCLFTKNGCTSLQNTMGVHGFIECGNITALMYEDALNYLLKNKKFLWVIFAEKQTPHFDKKRISKTYENTYVDVSKPYDEIKSCYKHSFKESLRKGRKSGNTYSYSTSFTAFRKFLKLYIENSKTLNYMLSNLQLFLIFLLFRKHIMFWFVLNSKKQIVCTALTLSTQTICTGYIIITSKEGKKYCANSMLIDYQISILTTLKQKLFYLGVSFDNEGISTYKKNISEKNELCCIFSKFQNAKRS